MLCIIFIKFPREVSSDLDLFDLKDNRSSGAEDMGATFVTVASEDDMQLAVGEAVYGSNTKGVKEDCLDWRCDVANTCKPLIDLASHGDQQT